MEIFIYLCGYVFIIFNYLCRIYLLYIFIYVFIIFMPHLFITLFIFIYLVSY
jgi:hypothetical protein